MYDANFLNNNCITNKILDAAYKVIYFPTKCCEKLGSNINILS